MSKMRDSVSRHIGRRTGRPAAWRTVILLVVGYGWVASCKPVGRSVSASPPPGILNAEMSSDRFAGTPEARWPDEAVARAVRSAIGDELGPRRGRALSVAVEHGVTLLTGATDTLLTKRAAQEAAESVRGARSVVDELEVHTSARPDSAVAEDVRRSWGALPCSEEDRLKVDVQRGTVTLRGMVDSQQRRWWAARAAAGVRGVVAVQDQILVRTPPVRTDADISQDVRGRLRWRLPLEANAIAVRVNGGTVALSGPVATPKDLDRAEMLARVAGARAVDVSGLVVDPGAFPIEPPAPPAVSASDDALAQAIRDAMFYDPRLDRYDVSVSVDHGVATLSGHVPSLLAAGAAREDAAGTSGIRRTIDRISIPFAPVASDALLAQSVMKAFAREPLADLGNIKVQANRGLVRLFGTVAGQLARGRALEVASSVGGVRTLVDDLKVAEAQAPGGQGGQAHRQSRASSLR